MSIYTCDGYLLFIIESWLACIIVIKNVLLNSSYDLACANYHFYLNAFPQVVIWYWNYGNCRIQTDTLSHSLIWTGEHPILELWELSDLDWYTFSFPYNDRSTSHTGIVGIIGPRPIHFLIPLKL